VYPDGRMGTRIAHLLGGLLAVVLVFAAADANAACKPPRVMCNGKCVYECKRSGGGSAKLKKALKACRKSEACTKRGLCALNRKGKCVRATKRGCADSKDCALLGTCEPAKNRQSCVATKPDHCRNTEQCKMQGKCSPSDGACARTSDLDCQRSTLCSAKGLCSHNAGQCRAATVADCRGSTECRNGGRCELFAGRCEKPCSGGRVRSSGSKGLCCWPGQRKKGGACSGTPVSCPSGLEPRAGDCRKPSAKHFAGQPRDGGRRLGEGTSRAGTDMAWLATPGAERLLKEIGKNKLITKACSNGKNHTAHCAYEVKRFLLPKCKRGDTTACKMAKLVTQQAKRNAVLAKKDAKRTAAARKLGGGVGTTKSNRTLGGGVQRRSLGGGVSKTTRRAGTTTGPIGRAGIRWVSLPAGRLGKRAVDPFRIARIETSVDQYMKCVRARVCKPPKKGSWPPYYAGTHPVVGVDMYQAQVFCKWAGGQLPSDLQWKYAASSAGTTFPYPWGGASATCERAVLNNGYDACRKFHVLPACSKPAGKSRQGVCDLAGNVREWTSSGAVRGGGIKTRGNYVRYDSYTTLSKSLSAKDVGFRCATR